MKKIILSDKQKIINSTISDIRGLVFESELETFNKDILISSLSDILQSAKVDTDIIIEVIQEFSGEEARNIKVKHGY